MTNEERDFLEQRRVGGPALFAAGVPLPPEMLRLLPAKLITQIAKYGRGDRFVGWEVAITEKGLRKLDALVVAEVIR